MQMRVKLMWALQNCWRKGWVIQVGFWGVVLDSDMVVGSCEYRWSGESMAGVFITAALIGTRDLINWVCTQGQFWVELPLKGMVRGKLIKFELW